MAHAVCTTSRCSRFLCFIVVGALLAASVRPAQARGVRPEAVDATIQNAVKYIYSQQKPSGHWEVDDARKGTEHDWSSMQGGTFGGYTALCVFALLEAGEKPTDPRVLKGINFLKTCDMFGTYSLGLRCMVWSRLGQSPEIKKLLQDDANRLMTGMIRDGAARGFWDYESGIKRVAVGIPDRSCSQFGVLGLWAAAEAGANVPPENWRTIDTVWRASQSHDGSWSYNQPAGAIIEGTPSMTAAGAATLLIVQDILGSLAGAGGTSVPTGDDSAINQSLAFLAKAFDRIPDAGNYGWYAIERIGTAGGFRFIGDKDWYTIGAQKLMATQISDGSWPKALPPSLPLSETAFGILFLSHGRAPVLMSKLNYNAAADGTPPRNAVWHQYPRDAANLTRYIAHGLELTFNWQIVTFAASTEDLLDAPVMLVTGNRAIDFTPREKEKLKAYLDGGGLILSITGAMPRGGAKLGTDGFSNSILQLGRAIYPGYAFRELPPNHPIYADEQYKPNSWKEKPVVWGLSNGVRELIILLPQGDAPKSWNANKPDADAPRWQLGADIAEYAITRTSPKAKGYGHYIPANYWTDAATRPTSRPTSQPATNPADPTANADPFPADTRFMTVGRLRVGANWDPEPGAWQRMTNLLANDFHLFLEIRPVDADAKQLAGIKLLHWTGTTAVKLMEPQKAALKAYVAGGGTLVVDAAGGSSAFADSAGAELLAVFGGGAHELGAFLAPDDPVFNMRDGAIQKVAYRRYASGRVTGKLDVPRLRGVDQGGRTTIFFSREDITAGCVGQNTDGIIGYSPQAATAIMRNITLAAAKKK